MSHLFRPWLVATLTGSTLGSALLYFQSGRPAEDPNLYVDLPPRSAVYEHAVNESPAFDSPEAALVMPAAIDGVADSVSAASLPLVEPAPARQDAQAETAR